ncbi:MAG: redox-sensing transcriptional repressor Rex [Oscillospiraceae bacterium]|nr:redox-sensing transcriptional repressor Rex [Oscillospiraceae bacterium]
MEANKVSNRLLSRLPVYLNYMKSLPEATETISATRMASALGLGDVLVRKDLAKISSGGRRKVGYVREDLIKDIEDFLDVNRTTCGILVGAGKLGQALLDYEGFEKSGLHILAGFDINPAAPQTDRGKPIYAMNRLGAFCKCYDVSIGIITVPAEHAQAVCDRLVACNIEAIWNFSPVHLKVPEHVVVQTENLAASLTTLKMQLKNRNKS